MGGGLLNASSGRPFRAQMLIGVFTQGKGPGLWLGRTFGARDTSGVRCGKVRRGGVFGRRAEDCGS